MEERHFACLVLSCLGSKRKMRMIGFLIRKVLARICSCSYFGISVQRETRQEKEVEIRRIDREYILQIHHPR